MKAVHPNVIAAQNDDDGADSTATVATAGIGGRTFSGTITGRLVSSYRNDLGVLVTLPLAGVLVKLKEKDRLFNEEFKETTTDANGYFTLTYSESQSDFEGKRIEPFLKIKSKNRNYDIKVKDAAVLGSSYDFVYRLGSHGKNVNIVVGDIIAKGEPWRLLHWAVRAWDYVKGQGFPLFKGLSVLPYRDRSNMVGDGLFGISLPITNPTIRIKSGDGDHEGTMRHEFGHFTMWCLQGRNYITVYSKSKHHFWEEENTSRIAWSEGWANAIEMILDAVYWNEDQEYGSDESDRFYEFRNEYSINVGLWSEYYVACAIYDLWDGVSKGVPVTVGNTYVGYNDATIANIPQGGWTETDNTELTFYQIARPLVIRAGTTNKIQHIGDYFSTLINDVIGTGNCSSVSDISNVFAQNRVVYDIYWYENGDNTGLSSDLLAKPITKSITGQLGGVSFTYSDTYSINPYTSTAHEFFLPTSGSAALTDDIFLTQSLTSKTIKLNPVRNGASSGTFYTCGNIEIVVDHASIILGGTSARLELRSGSTYRMKAGSVLVINNNSTLAIMCGAKLIFEPGASIQLNGTNAKIVIDGTLQVQPGATFNYPYTQSTPSIIGLDGIPLGGGTYSSSITTAPSYTWTVPSGWSINNQNVSYLTIAGSAGATVTIKPPANATCGSAGLIRLTASGCTQSQASKSVTISIVPYLSVSTYDDRTPQPSNYTYHTATAQLVPGTVSSNYKWYNEVNGSATTLITTGLTLHLWPIPPCSSKFYQLQVTMTCGVAVYRGYAYNGYRCGGSFFVSVSPNPASDNISISVVSSETTEIMNASDVNTRSADAPIFNFDIYDQFGSKALSGRDISEKAVIDVKSLPNGLYVLKVINGSVTKSTRIVVKR